MGHSFASSSWLNFCLKVSRDAASLIPSLPTLAPSLAPMVVTSGVVFRTGWCLKPGRASAKVSWRADVASVRGACVAAFFAVRAAVLCTPVWPRRQASQETRERASAGNVPSCAAPGVQL